MWRQWQVGEEPDEEDAKNNEAGNCNQDAGEAEA